MLLSYALVDSKYCGIITGRRNLAVSLWRCVSSVAKGSQYTLFQHSVFQVCAWGLDSTVSGQGPVADCCECGDEPSGSCATELI
jgi:hypothetical protein